MNLKNYFFLLLCLISLNSIGQNLGFEAATATPPTNWTAVTGTWTVNTNPSFVRTGTQSMTITDPATSGTTIGTVSPFVTTAAAGNYLISIGWGKSNTASNALFYLGYRSGTTNTLNPTTTTAGQPANINDVSWSRISSASAVTVAAGSYGTSLRAFRSAATAGTILYFDDIITYASPSNIPDLTAPDPVSGLLKTGNVLSWANGADNGAPASGIGGVVIIRADGVSLTPPSLNDQAMYTTGASGSAGTGTFINGSDTWAVIANIAGSGTTSFDDVSAGAGPYTYVVYMRDLAFNYSTGSAISASDPCINPPTPGTTNASPSSPTCNAQSVTLSLTGGTGGVGQTFQWESSTLSGGPYTPVSGVLTSSSFIVNPTANTYYRAIVTCGVSVNSTEILVTVPPPFSGTFTINSALATGGSNYQTFTEAVAALSCGIAGPVVFNVDAASGPYSEQVTIPVILGASATNTVTFNGNGRTLQHTPLTGARHIIKLDGADYVTFNNLNIVGLDATFGWGIHLMNLANNNTINNCTIDLSAVTSTTTTNSAGITASNSTTSNTVAGNNANNTTITNNTIIGGYYGISFLGETANKSMSNVISNNTVRYFYTYGISIDNHNRTTIEGNDIHRANRVAVGSFYGIDMGVGNEGVSVNANRIHDTHTSASTQTGLAYGIQIISCDAPIGLENTISNNLIYNFNSGSGIQYGLYNSGSDNVWFHHNTVVLDHGGSTAGTTRGFSQLTTATGIELKNNIFKIARGGTGAKHLIYFGATGTASTITSNNNDLLITSTAGTNFTGYLALPTPATSYASIGDWQGASGQDANSVAIEPNFANPGTGNYKPLAAALNDLGTASFVTADILGDSRDPFTPDMGAYEFDVSGCASPPTPGITTSDAAGTICPGNTVNIDLTGNSFGTGQTYELESSTSLGGPYTPVGGGTQPTSSFTINPTISGYYRVAVTCSGSTEYSTPVFISIAVPMPGGSYTINSAVATGGSNFQTFAAAIAAMNCGIAGPIVFDVDAASGPYTEQISIPVIPGSSGSNTITFNGNGRTLQFTPVTGARHIIKLDGADYVTINNLNIVGLDAAFGWGIHLINQANNNTISNCTINMSAVTNVTQSNSAGIVASNSATSVVSGGNNANNTSITGNTITGAYQGIIFYGGSTTVLANNNISNNTIEDFYSYGVYMLYSSGSEISNNDIKRPALIAVGTFYGIYLGTGNTNASVNANRIHDTHNSASTQSGIAYGINITSSDAIAGFETKITNNLIYNFNSTTGTQYGLYNSGSDSAWFHHNTVVLDEASSTAGLTYGFYQTTLATGIEVKNNLIKIDRGGTGSKYLLYFATSTTLFESDFNDLLITSTGGTINATGFLSGATPTTNPTLAEWQAASSKDANSVVIAPNFSSPGTGNYKPLAAALNNLGTASFVMNDILGDPRDPSTPDIGAYEFDVAACVAPPTPGTTTSDAIGIICPNTLVNINLSGNSIGTGQTYQLETADNIGGPYTPTGTSQAGTGFTHNPLATVYYRVAVTCSGNTQYSVPVMVTVAQLYPAGTYTINSATGTGGGNFQTFNDAVAAIACGIAGPVIFNVEAASGPYTEQVTIPAIYNTSSINTITINGNGRTLQFAPVTGARHIIKLDGTDYTHINDLNIVSTDVAFGWGIHLMNQANNNTISNCTINLSAVTSTTVSNFAGIVASNSSTSAVSTGNNANFTNITGNTIIGGGYGIAMLGLSTAKSMNNNILNNTIRDFYSYGISLDQHNGTTVAFNNINRATRVAVGSFYGIDLGTGNQSVTINANRIHSTHTAATTQSGLAYGIQMLSCDAPAGFENKVTNNLLYKFNSLTGIQYGIYNSSSDSVWYYHNTIVLDNAGSTSGTTRGFYQITLANGVEFKNNIVKIARSGTGSKHAIYFGTATSPIISDNNDLLMKSTGGTTNMTGYLAGATPVDKLTLADWQSTGQDASSIALEPFFEDESNGIYKPQESLMDNLGASVGIANDIVNTLRNGATPDMGAYEFTGTVTVPVKLLTLYASKLKADVLVNWSVAAEINSSHYEIERSANGTQFVYAGTITAANQANTTAYGFTDRNAVNFATGPVMYYRLKMVDKDGRYEYSPVAIVKMDKELMTSVEVYPNPYRYQANLRINVTGKAVAHISITDLSGKILSKQVQVLQAGISLVTLDKSNQLSAGIYLARIIIEGKPYVVKLIKQ